MTLAATPRAATEPPAKFTGQVAEALRRLYDPSGLLRSPLLEWLIPPDSSPERRSRALRALLLETIESLNPGPKVSFRSLSARSYQAIRLHYVDGHTVAEVSRLLALSLRQAYRDIRRGEADIAMLLWQRRLHRDEEALPSPSQALRQEIERLPLSPTSVSLRQALREAGESVISLAQSAGIALSLELADDFTVRADPTGLRQCLTAVLSYAVQLGAGQIGVSAGREGEVVLLQVRCSAIVGERLGQLASLLATARTLAEAIGAELHSWSDGRQAHLCLRLPSAGPATIIVIDDNEGLPQLFQRYLSESNCDVLGATDAAEGLRLAQECPATAIVLDILMPGTDGWALLAQLKANPAIASVPVIVCSVFNDPGLARSLGAAAFISKPVSQASLLQALADLGLAWRSAAAPAAAVPRAP